MQRLDTHAPARNPVAPRDALATVARLTSPPFSSPAHFYDRSASELACVEAGRLGWLARDGSGAWSVTPAGRRELALTGGVKPPVKARAARRDREELPEALPLPFASAIAESPPPSLVADPVDPPASSTARAGARSAPFAPFRRRKRREL